MRTWATRLLLAIAVLVAATAGPAGAHVEVFESDPTDGGTTEAGTEAISLTFLSLDTSTPVEVAVLDEDGTDRVAGSPRPLPPDEGTEVVVPVEPLALGPHTVEWRAVSEDGDGFQSGSYSFTVVEPADRGATWVFGLGLVLVIIGVGGVLYRLSRRSG